MKRRPIPRSASRRDFTRKASKVNPKNGMSLNPMRGGIRF